MKELLLSVAVVAAALAVVAAAVFGAGDDATLVPPPEAAAEEFTRELAEERYALAWRQLSSEARQREREAQLHSRFEPVLEQLGKINQVDASETFRDDATAVAMSHIDGSSGDATLTITLARERGVWKVDRWEVTAETR
jgi:leucyl aminopeptidase (aminopeptidase T)